MDKDVIWSKASESNIGYRVYPKHHIQKKFVTLQEEMETETDMKVPVKKYLLVSPIY